MRESGTEWKLGSKSVSFGSVLSDLNGDGNLDVVVNNFDGLHRSSRTPVHQEVIGLLCNLLGRQATGLALVPP